MKIKCKYCNEMIDDIFELCPICNAPNSMHYRIVKGTPKTIKELKDWCEDRKLPSDAIITYCIGENKDDKNILGIYGDHNQYVLYLNNQNGEKEVIYKGADEEYAVSEAYIRIKEDILSNMSKGQYEIVKINRQQKANEYRKIVKFSGVVRRIDILLGLLLACSVFLQIIFRSVYR